MPDKFYGAEPGFAGPTTGAFAITADDNVSFDQPTREIYVGGAGDVAVLMLTTEVPVIFKAVPVGTVLRVRARRVLSTGTTATNLIGMF